MGGLQLASPWGLLAAGLAVPLIAWYLLRSRRPASTVASTFLWQRSEHSVAAAVPWQRFRGDVTFWLVLLALLAGAVALAGPFTRVPAELGDHTILIVDASGSMLANEEGPTRLELARREARDLIDRLGPGQVVSVVEAGTRARVLLSASDDQATIRDVLGAVRPTHGPADLVDAFTLATALQRPGQSTVTHLLTDGAVPPGAQDVEPPGLHVTAVGTDRPNLAVTRLQTVALGAGSSQAFVQVRNLGPLPASARLTLSIDGEDVVSEDVQLGPRGTADRVLQVAGGDGEILTARIEPRGQAVTGDTAADALTVDDRAYAVLSAPRELTILIAGPGNVFLEAALGAVPGATVETADRVPVELLQRGGREDPGRRADVDLLVVDRVAGPEAPVVPTLYVAPSRWPAGVDAGTPVERPALTYQAPNHELLADVDLSGVGIAVATPLSTAALGTLASGPDGSLILAGRLDGAPVVLIGFDLLGSNLPLQAAWPVFAANLTSWLAGPPAAPAAITGSTVSLATPVGTERIDVSPPAGDTLQLDVATPRVTLDQVGVWRLRYVGELAEQAPTAVAVNADPAESDLARARPDPVAQREAAVASGTAPASEGRRSWVLPVLMAVLALVVLEWLWTHAWRPWRRRRRQQRSTTVTAAATPDRAGDGRRIGANR